MFIIDMERKMDEDYEQALSELNQEFPGARIAMLKRSEKSRVLTLINTTLVFLIIAGLGLCGWILKVYYL